MALRSEASLGVPAPRNLMEKMVEIRESDLRIVYKGTGIMVPEKFADMRDYVKLFEDMFEMSSLAQEVFCAIYLDERNHITGIEKVFAGDNMSVETSNHELLKRALAHNATRLIVAHNHPGDSPVPSFDDLIQTWVLSQTGSYVGVDVVNHVIISDEGTFCPIIDSLSDYEYDINFIPNRKKLMKVYKKIRKKGFLVLPLPIKWYNA